MCSPYVYLGQPTVPAIINSFFYTANKSAGTLLSFVSDRPIDSYMPILQQALVVGSQIGNFSQWKRCVYTICDYTHFEILININEGNYM